MFSILRPVEIADSSRQSRPGDMASAPRCGTQNTPGHCTVGDGCVGELIPGHRPRCRTKASAGRHIKCPLGLSTNAADSSGTNADVLHTVVRIRSDLAASEVVRRIRHVADGDGAWIA